MDVKSYVWMLISDVTMLISDVTMLISDVTMLISDVNKRYNNVRIDKVSYSRNNLKFLHNMCSVLGFEIGPYVSNITPNTEHNAGIEHTVF